MHNTTYTINSTSWKFLCQHLQNTTNIRKHFRRFKCEFKNTECHQRLSSQILNFLPHNLQVWQFTFCFSDFYLWNVSKSNFYIFSKRLSKLAISLKRNLETQLIHVANPSVTAQMSTSKNRLILKQWYCFISICKNWVYTMFTLQDDTNQKAPFFLPLEQFSILGVTPVKTNEPLYNSLLLPASWDTLFQRDFQIH